MKKTYLKAAGFLLVLVLFFLAGCTQTTLGGILQSQQEGIWVTGTGKVAVAPDIANLSLGIEAQETTVAAAQVKVTETMNRVMDALTEYNIAKKDVQTQYFSISQVTRWDDDKNQEVVIGYRVSNMVVAKIWTLDGIGAIIDAVAVAGGDLTRIRGINFAVDDPSEYYEEARKKAMEQAEVTAKQLANFGGVALGKPSYISESTFTPPPVTRVMLEAAPAPMPTPISPGEMEISLNVQVVYAIVK